MNKKAVENPDAYITALLQEAKAALDWPVLPGPIPKAHDLPGILPRKRMETILPETAAGQRDRPVFREKRRR